MIIGWIYRLITAMFVVLITWEIFRERSIRRQSVAAMVLIPLILRMLMIK